MALSACSKGQNGAPAAAPAGPVNLKVERIDLGTAIDADKKVTTPATRFKSSDTIYASIVGEGVATRSTLRTRWLTDRGRLTYDASQYVVPNGITIAEFHSPSPNNWPAGKYRVELFVDTQPAGSVDFTIAD